MEQNQPRWVASAAGCTAGSMWAGKSQSLTKDHPQQIKKSIKLIKNPSNSLAYCRLADLSLLRFFISIFLPVRFPNPLTGVSGLGNLTTFFLAYILILKILTLSNSLISTSSKRWWLAVGKTFNLLFSLLAWSEHKHTGHILILTLKFYCYLFDCFGCGYGWHARVIFWCCYQYKT